MKKKGMTLGLLLSGAGILILLYMTGESYLNGLAGSNRQMQADTKEYMYKYDMIVDNPESSFWQAVYASAEKWARENDSLLELKGTDEESQYTKLDYMNVSIASRADGIILQYSGEDGLEDKIDEAVADGIPVVTLMNDAVHSKRQTFVGVSDYQLGSAYGEKVADYVTRIRRTF